jgi:sn1-specific diacylglycerol lipase
MTLYLPRLYRHARCCCCCGSGSTGSSESGETLPVIVGDTCSGCHLAALKQSIGRVDHEVIFASFHVDVAETPFFVAIDYDHQSVVVSIRGTISMKVLGDRSMKDINQILNLSVFWVP